MSKLNAIGRTTPTSLGYNPPANRDIREHTKPGKTRTRQDESSRKSRNWIGTLNNYTELEYSRTMAWASEKCQYCVIGKETGEEGTPHLQVFFQMKTPYSGQTIKNFTSKRFWLGVQENPARGAKYCKKGKTGRPVSNLNRRRLLGTWRTERL